jgi:hypothetical protein
VNTAEASSVAVVLFAVEIVPPSLSVVGSGVVGADIGCGAVSAILCLNALDLDSAAEIVSGDRVSTRPEV